MRPRSKASKARDAAPSTRAKAEAILAVALLALVLVAIGVLAVKKQLRDGNDFPIYWQAARDFSSGRGLYDVRTGLHGYVYLPWFALMLAPLALLPLPVAASLWYVANLAFLWFAGKAALDALHAAGVQSSARVCFLAALPLAGLAHDNLVLGQANLFLLWLVTLAAREALSPRSAWHPGVPIGLAAALKMPAALLIAPLALRRRGRAPLAFAAVVVLAVAIPFLRTGALEGARLLDDWRAKVVAPAAAGTLQGSKVIDQSPHAGLRRLLVDAPAFGATNVHVASLSPEAFAQVSRAVALALLAAYALVWLLAPAKESPRALLLDLALVCCAMVQVTGFNLKAQFVVLLLPAWTASGIAWSRPAPAARWLLIAAGALFLLSQPSLVGRGASNWLLAYSSMAAGTLVLAAVLAIQRFATPSPSAAPGSAPGTGTAR